MKDRLPALYKGRIGNEQDHRRYQLELGRREQFFKAAMRPGSLRSVVTAIQECLTIRRREER